MCVAYIDTPFCSAEYFKVFLTCFQYCSKKLIENPSSHFIYRKAQKRIHSFNAFKHRKEIVLFANSSPRGLLLTFKIPDRSLMKVG